MAKRVESMFQGLGDRRMEAVAELRTILQPGDTVYCVLRHVSRSGMMRHISLLACEGRRLRDITYLASMATGIGLTKDGYVKMGGCGMDMGFAAVYDLGRAVYPGGNGSYSRCRNGDKGPEEDGGYFFRSEWM